MATSDRDRYHRFRHIFKDPWDKSNSGTFPLFTTDTPFRLEDYQNESANNSVAAFDQMVQTMPGELFLDLGCGRRAHKFENCLYLEVYPSVSADVIVDADCTYPILDNSFAGIGCFAVLEHTRKPWLVVQEMRRMLKPGGRVFIDWPFLQPVHGYPSHFFNATREGLTSIFEDEGFKVLHAFTGAHQTAAYTIWWILGRFAHQIADEGLRREFHQLRVTDLIKMDRQGPEWWRFLNALPPAAFAELASGNMLIADKEGGPLDYTPENLPDVPMPEPEVVQIGPDRRKWLDRLLGR
jgi:SAM-dependent methyltransferase